MDVKAIFERNSERLHKLYGGADQYPRYEKLAEDFRAHFGREPELFVSAPGRTEVIGNHTDHNRGHVLAAAVNLDTVAAAAPSEGSVVRLYSAGYDAPFVVDVADLAVHEEERETTSALIRGVAAKLKELGYKIGGFDAQVHSTVFKGSGLSSSAAFEVMLVAIFDALYNGWTVDAKLNARISQYAENAYFGKPCGVMDQSASAVGALVSFDFAPEVPEVDAIACNFGAKGYDLCVVSAGGEHGNLTAEYAAIPGEMKQVARALGREVLVDVTPEELLDSVPKLKGAVSDRAILRAFHFVDETRRVTEAVEALKRDDFAAFLDCLVRSGESSWMLLQNLYVAGSGNEELPLALEMSRRMLEGRGAWRINGGGFAGTIVAVVPKDLMPRYAAAMDATFGAGATTILSVRPEGVVCIR